MLWHVSADRHTTRVTVIDAFVGHEITTLPAENVFELGFSPFGTFIITWQRSAKDEEGNAVKNLKVWRTVDEGASASGERATVGSFVQRNQTGWNLQYTSDEKYCARVVTNEVQFYESGDLKTVWNKLRVEGVTDFAVAPGNTHSVAVFVPERKGQPAAVKVFTVPQFAAPVSQKTFFKGDKVQFKWNEPGTSLIVLAQTEVDKSNKSYYGETTMYILSANGGFDSRIALGMASRVGQWINANRIPQTRKAQFTMCLGRRMAKNLVLCTATCQRRRPFSTQRQYQHTTSPWRLEIPFSSPHTAASFLWPALEISQARWTFMT